MTQGLKLTVACVSIAELTAGEVPVDFDHTELVGLFMSFIFPKLSPITKSNLHL